MQEIGRELVRLAAPLIDRRGGAGTRPSTRPSVAVAEIESAITRHREQVTEIAEADLAEAAEIMLAPAVLAAAAAWAAADIVAAVVEVAAAAAAAVAVVDAVVEEVGGENEFDEEKTNENKNKSYDFVETLDDHCGDG